VRFIGCAPAWRPGEARDGISCLVVMDERGSIVANSFAGSAREIAEAVAGYGAQRRGVIVGVDAPLAVPNERGTRKIERILSKVALPAYSASRRMFGGEPYAEELLEELERVGIEYADYPFPRQRGQRVVVEVDSAATLKILSLETGNLSADLHSPENVDLSKLDVSESMSHAELDRVVSLVEGTLAAYTVHRHWKGRDGSMVVGTGDQGSVLLPATEALHARIAEECRAAGVPYV
jgi:predicted RNase H-like nuclease